MARITGGNFGKFSGKSGTLTSYTLRGKTYIRSLPRPSDRKPSEKQLAYRERFKLIQNWRSQFTDIFAITFKNHTHERSAQNAAHKLNANIVVGEYPNLTLDRTAFTISAGTLPPLKDVTMAREGNDLLRFTWNTEVKHEAKELDMAAIIVFYEDDINCDAELNAAYRSDGTCTLKLQFAEICKKGYVYFTMLSNDRERASNSVYLGSIDL